MSYLSRFSVLAFCLSILAFSVSAKKPKVLEGSLDPLNGVKKFNIQFVYEGMTIGKEELSDAEYIEKKKGEMNEKSKGTGDTWAIAWVADRSRKYELSFRNEFNRDSKIKVGSFPEEKYTLILKSTNLEPGYNIGISKRPSKLDCEAWLVETAHPETVVCKLQVKDAVGSMPFADLNNAERIRYSYIMAAHIIQDYMQDKLF